MKLSAFVNAAPALDKLFAANIDISIAYQLHKRLPEFTKQFNFYNAELDKCNKGYIGKEWKAKMANLLEFEVDYDTPPITIKIKDGITLSVNDLTALEPFVIFEEV